MYYICGYNIAFFAGLRVLFTAYRQPDNVNNKSSLVVYAFEKEAQKTLVLLLEGKVADISAFRLKRGAEIHVVARAFGYKETIKIEGMTITSTSGKPFFVNKTAYWVEKILYGQNVDKSCPDAEITKIKDYSTHFGHAVIRR